MFCVDGVGRNEEDDWTGLVERVYWGGRSGKVPYCTTPYLLAAICFMRFRALPALNHSICCWLNEWFSLILCTLPSVLISQSSCLPGAKLFRPRIEIFEVG